MNPYMTTTLLISLSLGTIITLSSTHWLLAWVGLEINTLAIIPLMAKNQHPRAIEATTKYFITQATAAAMLLFASTTNAWLSGQWDIQQTSHPLPILMFTLALALKIGLAPMHTWLPEVLQGLNLTMGLILTTWQKLAPFSLLLQIQQYNPHLLITLALTSAIIGGWGGLNQTQLRKILAYSSIAHLGWMMLIILYSPQLTLLAILIYIIMTFATFITFKINKSTNINMLSTTWTKFPTLTYLFPLTLLSLGGLPPLTGFMPKWLILQELTKQSLITTATIMALAALLSLYFYLRLLYSTTLTISPNNYTTTSQWRYYSPLMTLPLTTSMIMTIFLLPMTPLIIPLIIL
uniref:NADH-ubiquinone oxidoreductase chain 2 n=1 Tax=Ophisternon sp. b AFMS-2024 TaxID=3231494 RepID=A0AB39A6E9_9TELE